MNTQNDRKGPKIKNIKNALWTLLGLIAAAIGLPWLWELIKGTGKILKGIFPIIERLGHSIETVLASIVILMDRFQHDPFSEAGAVLLVLLVAGLWGINRFRRKY